MGSACCTDRERVFPPYDGDMQQSPKKIPASLKRDTDDELTPEIHREVARKKLLRLDVAGALACLDTALAMKPEYAAALCERASIKQWLHDIPGALKDADSALRLEPYDADAWAVRARLHAENRDSKLAGADIAEALRLAPSDADLFGYRSALREQTGDHSGAAKDFSAACKADWVWAFMCRGEMRVALGDIEGGISDFKQVPVSHRARGYAQGGLLWAEGKRPLGLDATASLV